MTEKSSAPEGEMPTLPDTGLQAALTLALTTLNDALDYLYNPFEPDNQSRTYIRIKGNCEKIRALAATSAAQAAGGGAWQPIETAPKDKDGPNVLLSNGIQVAQGWWVDEPGYIREKRDIDGVYIDQDESDGYTGWLDCDGGMLPEPTHWMPLPKPPAAPDHPSPSREGPSDAEMLAFLLAHCKVVYYPTGSGYPVEHNPFALGYPKDGAFLLGALRAAMKEHQP